VVYAVLLTGLAGCSGPPSTSGSGSGSGGIMTVTGHEVVVIDSNNNTEIWGVFPDVTGTSRAPVKVVNSAGHVIGSGVLRFEPKVSGEDGNKYNGDSENVSDFIAVYSFTVPVPRGLPAYGIKIGSRHGTVWLSAAQMNGSPVLTLGSISWMIPNVVRCPVTPGISKAAGMCAEHAGGAQFAGG
jgi:hypothetical protein